MASVPGSNRTSPLTADRSRRFSAAASIRMRARGGPGIAGSVLAGTSRAPAGELLVVLGHLLAEPVYGKTGPLRVVQLRLEGLFGLLFHDVRRERRNFGVGLELEDHRPVAGQGRVPRRAHLVRLVAVDA